MHFTSVTAAAILASLAIASPLSTLTRRASSWTVEDFTRTCDDAANHCIYQYVVNTNDGNPVTGCLYGISGTDTTSARQAPYRLSCGGLEIGSSWSGQFGPGNGFQTLSIVRGGLIIYPAYRDAEIPDRVVVVPDKSYTPEYLTLVEDVKVSR